MTLNDEREQKWDWSSVLLIVLAILVILVLTFELWVPHPAHGN
ncbi:MAG TPA: hypothetical protein VGF24_09940 [Vicinamibacterales bacterium]|jgi:hypothetical protein